MRTDYLQTATFFLSFFPLSISDERSQDASFQYLRSVAFPNNGVSAVLSFLKSTFGFGLKSFKVKLKYFKLYMHGIGQRNFAQAYIYLKHLVC